MHIATWNMQGAGHSEENKWNTGVRNLINYNANIICLQECGIVPASAQLVAANFGGIIGVNYYTWGTERTALHILYFPWDQNGHRCNLAVVAETPPVNASLVYPPAPGPVWRPALGFLTNQNVWVYSLHAISPGGPDAPRLLNAINAANPGAQWTALGDYNREPVTLHVPYIVNPPIQNTYSVTNPVRAIDYCVTNFGNQNWGAVQTGIVMSDHYPAIFVQ